MLHKLLFFVLLFSTFIYANEGPVGAKSTVSSKNVILGNIVELKIRARGKEATFPNITSIDGIKVLSRSERITNIHTYNHGKLERERTTLILTLAPQKNMTIPAYKIHIDGKDYQTKAIKIKVKKLKDSLFSLTLKANKKSVIVGEAFLVTVSFSIKHAAIISKQAQYERPRFQGFFVENSDKEKRYDEGDHQITELTYILTPHSQGHFTLGPAHAKIGFQDRKKSATLSMEYGTKWFEKASNTLDIEVLPQTLESDLVGKFFLSAKVDRQEVKANEPVHLTITIKGEGNLVNFDLLNYTLDNVTIYSDDAKVDIRQKEGKIYSSYSKKFVFISEKDFMIPEHLFTMIDPKAKAGKQQILKVKPFFISVESSKLPTATLNSGKPVVTQKVSKKERDARFSQKWSLLFLSFVMGSVLFYLLRYLPKHKRKEDKESEVLHRLYKHVSQDPEVEEMVRKLYAKKNGDHRVKIDKKKLKALLKKYP